MLKGLDCGGAAHCVSSLKVSMVSNGNAAVMRACLTSYLFWTLCSRVILRGRLP